MKEIDENHDCYSLRYVKDKPIQTLKNDDWIKLIQAEEQKFITIELANDIIMPDAALLHAAANIDFDIIVFIQPCAALITPEFINVGIRKITDDGYDSSFAVVRESWMPVWDLDINPIGWDINSRPRRQDKDEWYKEAGMFYITTKQNLLASGLRYSGNIGVVEIPLQDSFQIDNHQDLNLIRKIL
jgi:N-acylneuraminate cytidylyltransferase